MSEPFIKRSFFSFLKTKKLWFPTHHRCIVRSHILVGFDREFVFRTFQEQQTTKQPTNPKQQQRMVGLVVRFVVCALERCEIRTVYPNLRYDISQSNCIGSGSKVFWIDCYKNSLLTVIQTYFRLFCSQEVTDPLLHQQLGRSRSVKFVSCNVQCRWWA